MGEERLPAIRWPVMCHGSFSAVLRAVRSAWMAQTRATGWAVHDGWTACQPGATIIGRVCESPIAGTTRPDDPASTSMTGGPRSRVACRGGLFGAICPDGSRPAVPTGMSMTSGQHARPGPPSFGGGRPIRFARVRIGYVRAGSERDRCP